MVQFFGVLVALFFLVSCGSSTNSGSTNTDSTKAATGLSSAFSGNSRREIAEHVRSELESRAWVARFKAASSRTEMPTLTCTMITGSNFCSSGGHELSNEGGTEKVSCTQTASGTDCNVACSGSGKTVNVTCGADKIKMSDMSFAGTMQKPTCTDDGTNLNLTFCMIFKSMSAIVTYNTLAGKTLACGAADGSQKMCNTMVISKNPSTTSFSSAPSSSTSTLACTLDGTAVTMDFDNGKCS